MRRSSWACVIAVALMGGGCGGVGSQTTDEVAATVAAKASDVASQIGGPGGFGGSMMTGYLDHAPPMMGFVSQAELADPNATQTIVLRNESTEEATFHLTYFASYLGEPDQSEDVVVGAGETVEIEIPCSEIVGMGPLAMPGGAACHLSSGFQVDNTMAVPIFLGMDFVCTEQREFVLTPDTLDFDFDDDVDELILLSDGFVGHMQFGGPYGHTHWGMMGPHMMMGDFDDWDEWYDAVDSPAPSGMRWPGMMGWRN